MAIHARPRRRHLRRRPTTGTVRDFRIEAARGRLATVPNSSSRAFVRPRVPCVPCVSRLPPVSFYRKKDSGESVPCGVSTFDSVLGKYT